MDNMMNLELLFNAAGANPNTFPSIAENHAKTTTEHHLRGDGVICSVGVSGGLLTCRRLFFSRRGLRPWRC